MLAIQTTHQKQLQHFTQHTCTCTSGTFQVREKVIFGPEVQSLLLGIVREFSELYIATQFLDISVYFWSYQKWPFWDSVTI